MKKRDNLAHRHRPVTEVELIEAGWVYSADRGMWLDPLNSDIENPPYGFYFQEDAEEIQLARYAREQLPKQGRQ